MKRAVSDMRRVLLAALIGVLGPLPPAAAAASVSIVDRIVAVVNSEVITQKELDQRVALVARQLTRQGTSMPPRDALTAQILERLVVDRVQIQYARETGLRVDDVQLERALRRIAQENNMTLEQFRDTLKRDGADFDQFREDIRSEIVISRLREREVDNKVTVSDAEIDTFLAAQQGQGAPGDEYQVVHILVQVPEQAASEQIQSRRARAEEALARLKGGADFAQMAALYSDAADALQGGSLGWRTVARLPQIFAEAVVKMQPGEFSPVLRSPAGFHILQLTDKRGGANSVRITETHVRHILVRPSEIVSESEARNRLVQLKERIDHGTDFKELARLHSEDASAGRGGDMGWVTAGDTVPEFERAMNALKPGEVSAPVQSPFGWHLIQVLDRRSGEISKERERLLARQAIRARKADEAYQEWVRQLRDQAWVKYRTENP